jgi:phosphoglycolate phosphatase-like HAD superfamily hydrolase
MTRKTKLITILFDIDGTLIRSGGAGMIAIKQVMKQMFDLEEIASVEVHGRTDNGIFGDLFGHQSLSYDDHRDEFNAKYWELLPSTLQRTSGAVLPGVSELLKLLTNRNDIAMGILTGNSRRAAEIKLQHFELDSFFQFGGYGDFHSERNQVAELARQSAQSYLNDQFDETKMWVIGDTVNDVTCARHIGAQVLAVETGGGCKATLAESNPDCQLGSLVDTDSFMQAVGVSSVH